LDQDIASQNIPAPLTGALNFSDSPECSEMEDMLKHASLSDADTELASECSIPRKRHARQRIPLTNKIEKTKHVSKKGLQVRNMGVTKVAKVNITKDSE